MRTLFTIPHEKAGANNWGSVTTVDDLTEILFVPYTKNDRLCRATDWTSMAKLQQAYYSGHRSNKVAQVAAGFDFKSEEHQFQLVNSSKSANKTGFSEQHKRISLSKIHQTPYPSARSKQQFCPHTKTIRGLSGTTLRTTFPPSAHIQPKWRFLDELQPNSNLNKISYRPGEPKEVTFTGKVKLYQKIYDTTSAKSAILLQKTEEMFHSFTTLEDPIIQWLAARGEATIFATDILFCNLMCATRPFYVCDIIVTKKDGTLILDSRNGSPTVFIAANETRDTDSISDEKENINTPLGLFFETLRVKDDFSRQVLVDNGEGCLMGDRNVFAGETDHNEILSVAYKYRIWTLDSERIVVRCAVDAYTEIRGATQLVHVHTLNEFDPKPGMDWRHKLETQRGAILATEIKNNACKLAKWTTIALLSGVDFLKIGYVVRTLPQKNSAHSVIGLQTLKPREFATQTNLSFDFSWGFSKAIIEFLSKFEDGKYLLVRRPDKSIVELYEMPYQFV
jgi:translation initiation factor 3 subunit D